jgi:hypothetical protein
MTLVQIWIFDHFDKLDYLVFVVLVFTKFDSFNDNVLKYKNKN